MSDGAPAGKTLRKSASMPNNAMSKARSIEGRDRPARQRRRAIGSDSSKNSMRSADNSYDCARIGTPERQEKERRPARRVGCRTPPANGWCRHGEMSVMCERQRLTMSAEDHPAEKLCTDGAIFARHRRGQAPLQSARRVSKRDHGAGGEAASRIRRHGGGQIIGTQVDRPGQPIGIAWLCAGDFSPAPDAGVPARAARPGVR